jgi:peroxiredoxin
MAREEGAVFLDVGDVFPAITLQTVSGETISLPEATGPGYGVIMFYRAHW